MKLAHKLTLSFLFMALLIALVGLLATHSSARLLERQIGRVSAGLADKIMTVMDWHINHRVEEFHTYSQSASIQEALIASNREYDAMADPEGYIDLADEGWRTAPDDETTSLMQVCLSSPMADEFREILADYEKRYGYSVFGEMFVTNKYGANVAQSGRTSDFKQSDEPWWQLAAETGAYVGPVIYDRSAQVWSAELAVGIDDTGGASLGVLKVLLNLQEMINVIEMAQGEQTPEEGKPEAFVLIDSYRRVIYSTRPFTPLEGVDTVYPDFIFTPLPDDRPAVFRCRRNGNDLLCAYARSVGHRAFQGVGWVLVLEHDWARIHAPIARLRTSIWIMSGTVALFGLAIGLLISRSISGRIVSLREGAEIIGQGNFDHKVGSEARDEIGNLSRAFDRMAENLKSTTASRDELNREIAVRRRTETALRESEERLRSLFEGIDDGLFVHDKAGRILDCNEAVCRRLGYSREAMLQMRTSDIDAPEFAAGFEDRLKEQMERGRLSCEGVHVAHDGRRIPVDINTSVIDYHGEPAVLALMRDITDRKKTEDELRHTAEELARINERLESEIADRERAENALIHERNLLRTLIDNLPDYIFVKDRQSRFVINNRAHLVALGAAGQEHVKGRTDFDFFPRELAEVYHADEQAVMESGQPMMNHEEATIDAHGNLQWLTTIKVPFRDSRGAVVGIVGISHDITDRKRTEEMLRAERDHSARIIGGTPAIICGIAPDGTTTFVNPAGERITGYREEELVGRNWWKTFYPGDEYLQVEALFEAFEQGDVLDYEMTLTTRAGEKRTISWNSINRFNEEGKLIEVIGFGNDITERKHAEEQLRETLADLERSNRELEQFAYIASHDLQEPLRMVSSFTQLLARRYEGKLDEKADEYIGYAVDGARRMQKLLNGLLQYSRVATRGRALEPTDCEEVLAEALDNLRIAMEDSGAKITHDPMPIVLGDESQLIQLFQNLIGNALKFHGESPPIVHIGAESRDSKVLFSVRDNGIGIDPAHFDRVFLVFQRVHGSEDYPGTGIGLAICKKIVDRHNGRIWVDSQPGQGTTFFFTLPREGGPEP